MNPRQERHCCQQSPVYLVGGAVRDMLLGRTTHDLVCLAGYIRSDGVADALARLYHWIQNGVQARNFDRRTALARCWIAACEADLVRFTGRISRSMPSLSIFTTLSN
jgi:hypothetical protein